MKNFAPYSPVILWMYSDPVELGAATADADGTVSTDVTIPDLPPGVHRLQVQGVGLDGVQVTQELLVRIDGRPTGSYTTYLTGFNERPSTPTADAPIEPVEAFLNGSSLGQFQVDADGGVLVSVPSIDTLTGDPVIITATSLLSGRTVTEELDAIPSHPSLRASSTARDAVVLNGARFTADGLVHSEGGLTLNGASHRLTGGTEYGSVFAANGAKNVVTPAAWAIDVRAGTPRALGIEAYRPSGSVAASGVAYRAIPVSACLNGTWSPATGDTFTGVTYVPCSVALKKGVYRFAVAAEGSISLTGAGTTVGQGSAAPGTPALISGGPDGAVSLAGADLTVLGQVVSSGPVRSTGARVQLACGAVGTTISVSGADSSARMVPWCVSG